MKKITLLIVALAGLRVVNAQEIKFGPGVEIVTPVSKELGDLSGAGYGASFRGQIGFVDKFSVMGTVGYTQFGKKEVDNTESTFSMIPAQFGIKYALVDAEIAKLYFSAEAGIHNLTLKSSDEKFTSSVFSYAAGLGVQISKIDLGTKIQFMGKDDTGVNVNSTYFGIRLGYMFGI